MSYFAKRRALLVTLCLMTMALLLTYFSSFSAMLVSYSSFTGWLLVGLFLLLAVYNVRKKLTYPPLFKASNWMQLHVYLGYVSVSVFLVHTNFSLPTGIFESLLFWNVTLILASGIVGLIMTRSLPKRITAIGQEVIYERIPIFRRQGIDKADELIKLAAKARDSSVLQRFYVDTMRPDLTARVSFFGCLFRVGRGCRLLLNQLNGLKRYLSDEDKKVADELSEIISTRYDLDKQFVLQHSLKAWLFAHIPLTLTMFILLIVHLVLVHAF